MLVSAWIASFSILVEMARDKGGDESILELLKCLLLVPALYEGFIVLCQFSRCSGDIHKIENGAFILEA